MAQPTRRSRTGCLTCRDRHLKCDELLPVCNNCTKSNRGCVHGMRLNFTKARVYKPSPSTSAPSRRRFVDHESDVNFKNDLIFNDQQMLCGRVSFGFRILDQSISIASLFKGGVELYGRYVQLHSTADLMESEADLLPPPASEPTRKREYTPRRAPFRPMNRKRTVAKQSDITLSPGEQIDHSSSSSPPAVRGNTNFNTAPATLPLSSLSPTLTDYSESISCSSNSPTWDLSIPSSASLTPSPSFHQESISGTEQLESYYTHSKIFLQRIYHQYSPLVPPELEGSYL